MPSQWYCFTDDEAGPYTFQELAELIARGELQESDLVRRAEQRNWQRVDAVLGLLRAARTSGAKNRRNAGRSRGASRTSRIETALARWFPQADPRWLILVTSGLMILLLAIQLGWMFLNRPPRFPPSSGVPIVNVPSRLEQLRPRPPARPTLPHLALNQPVPVPGFEQVPWLKSPTLTASLLTIVYVTYSGEGTLDDLMIADRPSLMAPFSDHRLVQKTVTPAREAHPALSPDGLELIYAELGSPTRLWLSRREHVQAEFGSPVELVIGGQPAAGRHHDAPQFIDAHTIRITAGDVSFSERLQVFARRTGPGKPFTLAGPMPVANPWPRYFLTAGGRRAYFPSEDGIHVTVPYGRTGQFVPSEVLLGTGSVGKDLTKYDDTIWVAPQEDVLFYCGPGPESAGLQGHRLWMVRF